MAARGVALVVQLGALAASWAVGDPAARGVLLLVSMWAWGFQVGSRPWGPPSAPPS